MVGVVYSLVMDSLQDILGKRQFKAPDEIAAIQGYIQSHYKSDSSVRAEKDVVFIAVPSSTLAATLQLERQKIIDSCGLNNKRLVIRTGR